MAEFLHRQPGPSGIRCRINVRRAIDNVGPRRRNGAQPRAAIEHPNFLDPTPSGTRESKRARSRPSLETRTKWFEMKRRNNRQIDREPSANAERRILITNSWDENAGEVFGFHPFLGFAN